MPTLDQVRSSLDRDELDYTALAVDYDASVIPLLEQLVTEDDPRIAPKAAYLAALVDGEGSERVVALASRSRQDVVRVSAAAALAVLPTQHVSEIAGRMLADPDVGVRARALKSAAANGGPELQARIRQMATDDDLPQMRELAGALAAQMGTDG